MNGQTIHLGPRSLLRIVLLLLALLLTPALTFSCSSPSGRPMIDGQYRFLALGDSYTIGEAVGPTERWPVLLAERLRQRNVDIGDPVIIARTGWTTDELSAAIDRAAPQGPFDLVTLLIGVNNQYRGRTAKEFRGELARLLERAVKLAGDNPDRVLLISIPDWGVTPFAAGQQRDSATIAAEIDAFNQVKREEAARLGVQFIDITPISRKAAVDPSLTASDGLHPSARMYRDWTEMILPHAAKALEQR